MSRLEELCAIGEKVARAESVSALAQLATRPPLSSRDEPFVERLLFRLRAILSHALTCAAPKHLQEELPVAVRAARALVLLLGDGDALRQPTQSPGGRLSQTQELQFQLQHQHDLLVFMSTGASSSVGASEDEQQQHALRALLDAQTQELADCLLDLIDRAVSVRVDSHHFNRFSLTALAFDALSLLVPQRLHLLRSPASGICLVLFFCIIVI